MDTYAMILWSRAKESSIESQANQMFGALSILNKVDYLRPKYLTAYRKKDAKEFELSFKNVRNIILKERDRQFMDLGSRVSFFTSMNDNESVGISMSVGISNPRFVNTVVINLTDIKTEKMVSYHKMADIFKRLVEVCNPFYGCIACDKNKNMFNGYYNQEKDIPTSIFDINYWGRDIVSHLEIREEVLSKVYEYEEIDGGYYIRLLKEPIDVTKRKHIELQKDINYLLGI